MAADRDVCPEAAGLYAIAHGFALVHGEDDHKNVLRDHAGSQPYHGFPAQRGLQAATKGQECTGVDTEGFAYQYASSTQSPSIMGCH